MTILKKTVKTNSENKKQKHRKLDYKKHKKQKTKSRGKKEQNKRKLDCLINGPCFLVEVAH